MSTLHRLVLRTALVALPVLLLSACADYHCGALPNKAQCYAAYEEWDSCKTENRFLIRQVGEKVETTCRREPERCKNGKCWGGYERCETRSEPIYDYREYNRGVSQCMRQQGLANYDTYFNRPLF
jgi:hypothetical protein